MACGVQVRRGRRREYPAGAVGAELEVPHRPGQAATSTSALVPFVNLTLFLSLPCPQTQSLGFNAFRIPYSNEMLRDDAFVSGVWWGINPDLVGLTPLQCLDKIVEYCGQVGMHIILDRHSSQSDRFTQESYWFDRPLRSRSRSLFGLTPLPLLCRYVPGDPYYTEQRFIDDWVMLARRYRNTAIVAADLWNEPKMNATWGSGDLASDWRLAAERVGNAIQAVNPDWLLVVEGVGGATWWGGTAGRMYVCMLLAFPRGARLTRSPLSCLARTRGPDQSGRVPRAVQDPEQAGLLGARVLRGRVGAEVVYGPQVPCLAAHALVKTLT